MGKHFADALSSQLRVRKLTQKALADALQCSASSVSMILSGERLPQTEARMLALLSVLGLNPPSSPSEHLDLSALLSAYNTDRVEEEADSDRQVHRIAIMVQQILDLATIRQWEDALRQSREEARKLRNELRTLRALHAPHAAKTSNRLV